MSYYFFLNIQQVLIETDDPSYLPFDATPKVITTSKFIINAMYNNAIKDAKDTAMRIPILMAK